MKKIKLLGSLKFLNFKERVPCLGHLTIHSPQLIQCGLLTESTLEILTDIGQFLSHKEQLIHVFEFLVIENNLDDPIAPYLAPSGQRYLQNGLSIKRDRISREIIINIKVYEKVFPAIRPKKVFLPSKSVMKYPKEKNSVMYLKYKRMLLSFSGITMFFFMYFFPKLLMKDWRLPKEQIHPQ
ncbi:hypothetical protein RFV38_09015 [Cetobacterium sp. C33]|uniref:Uncharacterized protein n=1 Tax=Candidatus Cetobacterium colombiensis TaxID=3073100 RepID=A0ABU4WBV4_9FUSO|nr:hypothetical protein [Candidatus Cetobacterium colombiensis]MDX8336635.1 hypothetical protein [Candidatus Cetobacterium colombiensis]